VSRTFKDSKPFRESVGFQHRAVKAFRKQQRKQHDAQSLRWELRVVAQERQEVAA